MEAEAPRVLTLTMNPALDESFSVPRMTPASKIRCSAPRFDPGGGGINVARVLHALGEPAAAVFPVGGFLGQALLELLDQEGLATYGIPVPGETRQSHHVTDLATGLEYRFVLPGPALTVVDQRRCLDELLDRGAGTQYVVMSGSLPPGVGADFVCEVTAVVADLGARLVLDTSGEALRTARGAYLLKPSIRELENIVGCRLETLDHQVDAARELLSEAAASIVLLSRGNQGVLVVTAEALESIPALPGRVVSTVGAGDALVGGMVAGLLRGWDLSRAAGFAVACSAAMISTPGTSLFTLRDLEEFSDEDLSPRDPVGAGRIVPR